jgi:predicted esterase YcpF (UPF0227 family)
MLKMKKLDLKSKFKNEKIVKAIMALVENRRSIVGKGLGDYASFTLGETFIQLGMKEIIIGGVKYKLGKK